MSTIALAGALLQLSRAMPSIPAESQSARFRTLFAGEYDFIWRTLRRLGVPDGAVDDAAQEVFVVLARRLADIRGGTERSFLFGTARRIASDARKAQRRQPAAISDEMLTARADEAPSPEDAMQTREARAILDVILDAMDEDTRETFVLSELEGLGKPEVAALLDIPEGTVASRRRRGREIFQATLARFEKREAHRVGGHR